jgi:hypothetical protein
MTKRGVTGIITKGQQTMKVRDKMGSTWRPNPEVEGEWQIKLPGAEVWSDADLLADDGPFMGMCDLYPCRICPVNATYDELPELVKVLGQTPTCDECRSSHEGVE